MLPVRLVCLSSLTVALSICRVWVSRRVRIVYARRERQLFVGLSYECRLLKLLVALNTQTHAQVRKQKKTQRRGKKKMSSRYTSLPRNVRRTPTHSTLLTHKHNPPQPRQHTQASKTTLTLTHTRRHSLWLARHSHSLTLAHILYVLFCSVLERCVGRESRDQSKRSRCCVCGGARATTGICNYSGSYACVCGYVSVSVSMCDTMIGWCCVFTVVIVLRLWWHKTQRTRDKHELTCTSPHTPHTIFRQQLPESVHAHVPLFHHFSPTTQTSLATVQHNNKRSKERSSDTTEVTFLFLSPLLSCILRVCPSCYSSSLAFLCSLALIHVSLALTPLTLSSALQSFQCVQALGWQAVVGWLCGWSTANRWNAAGANKETPSFVSSLLCLSLPFVTLLLCRSQSVTLLLTVTVTVSSLLLVTLTTLYSHITVYWKHRDS